MTVIGDCRGASDSINADQIEMNYLEQVKRSERGQFLLWSLKRENKKEIIIIKTKRHYVYKPSGMDMRSHEEINIMNGGYR